MVRPAVSSVAIELTPHCNQKCDYCYNAWREDNGAAMGGSSPARVLSRIDRLCEAFDIDHFTVTGGEPFSRHDVFDVLARIRAHGAGTQIISNGGLVTDAIAARLAPLRPSYVQITLNGPDAALHEEHVGPGHFDKTLAGIRTLARHGVNVVGCVVITKKNAAFTRETLSLFRSLGVREIALSRFSPAGYAASKAAELLCTRDELTLALEQAHPAATEHGMSLLATMPVPPCAFEVERWPAIRFGVCAIGSSAQEFALGPDGRLRNCTLHGDAIDGAGDVLDLSIDALRALVRSDDVVAYKKKIPAFCEGCQHASTCAGGCGAAAQWVLGDARATPDPLVWQHIDDAFGARLARARMGKRRLETIL
jgi:radical SAM protein with 4Fe4S-binding SPASM domain